MLCGTAVWKNIGLAWHRSWDREWLAICNWFWVLFFRFGLHLSGWTIVEMLASAKLRICKNSVLWLFDSHGSDSQLTGHGVESFNVSSNRLMIPAKSFSVRNQVLKVLRQVPEPGNAEKRNGQVWTLSWNILAASLFSCMRNMPRQLLRGNLDDWYRTHISYPNEPIDLCILP
jgi:hypothetical protein